MTALAIALLVASVVAILWFGAHLVIGGEITLIRGEKAQTFRAGESCSVAAGEIHAEHVGPQGVAYIAGRRSPVA